jgi:Uncharacterized protein conserved in bacteria
LPEIKLVGLKARTCNADEFTGHSKIGPCVDQYFQNNMAHQIPHKKHPGRTFAAYGEYESDHKGDYTFYLGEEVTSFEGVSPPFYGHLIPAQTYQKFTLPAGPIPEVVREAWQEIWAMSNQDLGGTRLYQTDFQIYEEREGDPSSPLITIYVGIAPSAQNFTP